MTAGKTQVNNRLAEVRKSRGVGAADLARRVQVSRQTIYAIEAGTYVPNTEVALNLAHELEVTVDELFSLQRSSQAPPETLATEVLSAGTPCQGQPMRICQIGSRWVSVPVTATPYHLPEADGVIKRVRANQGRADLLVFAKEEAAHKRLLIAGCDPAIGLLSRMVERNSGIEIVSAAASSKLALSWLSNGKVHIAGCHLEDPKTGEFNLPYIRKQFPGNDVTVVTFAHWEEGLVVASGNPKNVRRIEDLARKKIQLLNREPGSGSRALLDKLLQTAGLDVQQIQGYDQIAYGHLAAAYGVLSRAADVCLATRSAAQNFGLDFLPLHTARYDLVMYRQTAELPAVRVLLDILQRATLRRKLEVLAGYDTSKTGTIVA